MVGVGGLPHDTHHFSDDLVRTTMRRHRRSPLPVLVIRVATRGPDPSRIAHNRLGAGQFPETNLPGVILTPCR